MVDETLNQTNGKGMGFIRSIAIAISSGIGVGSAYYILGGVASTVFPTITPIVAGVVGFGTAFAIAISKTA
jgi:hypothetical protein